jgi:hypothetical protein
MRHFCDLRAIEHLGEPADFSLSHGAAPLAAEQVLADIGTFEAELARGDNGPPPRPAPKAAKR